MLEWNRYVFYSNHMRFNFCFVMIIVAQCLLMPPTLNVYYSTDILIT